MSAEQIIASAAVRVIASAAVRVIAHDHDYGIPPTAITAARQLPTMQPMAETNVSTPSLLPISITVYSPTNSFITSQTITSAAGSITEATPTARKTRKQHLQPTFDYDLDIDPAANEVSFFRTMLCQPRICLSDSVTRLPLTTN
jgi:hypothetical protein